MRRITILAWLVVGLTSATTAMADTYYRMQGNACKGISEAAPTGSSGAGKYRVTSDASLSGVVCPIVSHKSLNGPKRIVVITTGIEPNNASFVGCSAANGSLMPSHSRNYINIVGNNLTNLTCILGRNDTIDWVYWVEP